MSLELFEFLKQFLIDFLMNQPNLKKLCQQVKILFRWEFDQVFQDLYFPLFDGGVCLPFNKVRKKSSSPI